jgi:hypothetical protein
MLPFPVFVATYPRRASTPPHLYGPGALCVEIPLPPSPLTCCDHTVLILSGRSRPVWDPVGVAVHYCLKSFTCNTYGPPRKCCKQKTYGQAKPFRCNTYRKHGGWATASSAASHSPLLSCSCAQALSFHTLAHSLAPRKKSTHLFSSVSALFAPKHPGWGYLKLFNRSSIAVVGRDVPIRPIAAQSLWCNNLQRREISSTSGETTPLSPVSKITRADIGNCPPTLPIASRAWVRRSNTGFMVCTYKP